MSTFLTRSATSHSSSYPIVLTRLGGPLSRPNPHLKFGSAGEWTRDLMISSQARWPLDQWGGHIYIYIYIYIYIIFFVLCGHIRYTVKFVHPFIYINNLTYHRLSILLNGLFFFITMDWIPLMDVFGRETILQFLYV